MWKVTELVSQRIYFNSKQKTTWFPLQIIPLESNALPHSPQPYVYALLEGFFWDTSQLRLDVLHGFKKSSLDDFLEFEEKKSSHGVRSEVFSKTVMFLSAKKCRIYRTLWTGGLSWWSSHNFSFQVFLISKKKIFQIFMFIFINISICI